MYRDTFLSYRFTRKHSYISIYVREMLHAIDQNNFFVRILIMIHKKNKREYNLIQIRYAIILRCFLRGKLFFMNYSGRLVTKSNMAAPDEFIIVVNTNRKASVCQLFGLIKIPRNLKLNENTTVYLSNLATTSRGTMKLRDILGRYLPTPLSKSQMKNRPPRSTTSTTTPDFVRILNYYLIKSYSYLHLFLTVENTKELTSTSHT